MQAGDFVCGHIRLLEPLPPGLGSPVLGPGFLALDEQTGTELWLCPIEGELVPSPMDKAEFMAGANGLATARHPDLVRVASVDREGESCLVGYEALPGALPLQQAIRDGMVRASSVIPHAAALARGLAFLHERGLVHGLLSASAVVAWEGSLVLWQHGLVQYIDAGRVNEGYRRFVGSELFAPEMTQGHLLPTADVYGWATIVAQLVVGSGPQESVGAVMSSIPEGAPPMLVKLLRECLSPDFAHRPGDGAALLMRLDAVERVAASQSGAAFAAVPDADLSGPPPAPRSGPKGNRGSAPPPIPVPDAATTADELALSLSKTDLLLSEITGEEVEQQPKLELRAHESTARLKALAADAVRDASDSAKMRVDRVLGNADVEPELTELALEGREDLEPVEGLTPIGVAAHRSSPSHEPPPRFAPTTDPKLEFDRSSPSRDVVSAKGPREPSGPGAGPMLGVFLSLITGIVGWSAAAALTGGATLSDGPAELERGDTPDGMEPAGGTASEGTGDATPPGGGVALPVPEQPPPPADCPKGMVPIDDRTCIDVAEAPGLRRLPLAQVSHSDAQTACEGRGARLCSLGEWQQACRGTGKRKRKVPYGGQPNADTCNTASIAGFKREVQPAGSLAKCKTPEGVYDMVGNVGEWTAEGHAVGGDSETGHKKAICTAKGKPPKDYKGPDLGYRCCAGR